MFAFFNNVPENGFVYNFGNDVPLMKASTEEQRKQLAELDGKVAAAEQRLESMQPDISKAQRGWEKRLSRSAPLRWTIADGQVFEAGLDEKARRFHGKRSIDPGLSVGKLDY